VHCPFTGSRNCTTVAVKGPVFATPPVVPEVEGAGVCLGAADPEGCPPPVGMAAAVMQAPTETADRSAAWLAVMVVESEKFTVVWLVADCTCMDPADTCAIVPLAADRCGAP